jgi:MarR family transcriptional regulator, organic hydroperoxide resistance regulator
MEEQPGVATVLDPQQGRNAGSVPATPAPVAAPGGHSHPLSEPVPHAEPLGDEQLNQQISETFSEILKFAHDLSQSIATELGLTGSDAIALFKLDAPMTMKELGQKMGCDPSFVTTVADALEKHGLARREPSLRDRRSKNIVLTPEGVTVRDRLCAEAMIRAPWCTELDTGERRCLLGLMRKMLRSRCRR